MSTIEFLHSIVWILVGMICAYGLTIDQFQQALIAQYSSRVLYIFVILTGLFNVVHTVAMSPLLVWIQFILEIITIGLFDFLLTYKRNKRGFKSNFVILLIFAFAITSLLAVVVQYFYG